MFSRSSKSPRPRSGGDISAIFVHAGAGYHSVQNEGIHLQACNDAAKAAMALLHAGGSAIDAVEMAIKVLEDREITNAGYGSNLAMDGVVECDASIVDHYGRSGAVGAVAQVKNPISLARLVLLHTTKTLTLRRVPPNLLVSQGATDFAFEQGMPVLPHDSLVSPGAKERWIRWKTDLKHAERKEAKKAKAMEADRKLENPEEQLRNKLRNQHTRTLLGNNLDDHSLSPSPSNDDLEWRSQASSPSGVTNTSSWTSPESPQTPQSVRSADSLRSDSSRVYVDPRGPPPSIHESSRSTFINSTETVPTLGNYRAVAPSIPTHFETDDAMSDIDDTASGAWIAGAHQPHAWADGSSGGESSASSDTLQLPSLTPSPPPPLALDTPLAEVHVEQRTHSQSPTLITSAASSALPRRGSDPKDTSSTGKEDHITDTVGAIAIDSHGNIACGASSGGIGMKYRGRVGPAALVGVGAAVVPINAEDKLKTCVATVTSGTGEHMATTMAATVCAERLYHSNKKIKGGFFEETHDDDAIKSMIESEFMGHPSVKHSNSAGAIGILGVKKSRDGVYLYFAHNTDSFAIASMHSDDPKPVCTMSRSNGNGSIAQGGRAMRFRRKM